MAIDQRSAVPLGAQIRLDLVRRIRSGELSVGKRVPSLKALATEYDVAELTVHNAIRELQHEGVLESVSGRGTFVVADPGAEKPATEDELAELRATVTDLAQRVARLEDTRSHD